MDLYMVGWKEIVSNAFISIHDCVAINKISFNISKWNNFDILWEVCYHAKVNKLLSLLLDITSEYWVWYFPYGSYLRPNDKIKHHVVLIPGCSTVFQMLSGNLL